MSYTSWFIAFLVFLGLELISMGLTSIWFAVGSLAALAASLLGAPTWAQVIVFVVVSTLIIVFLRPFAKRYVNSNTEKTNVESMEGKTGKVTVTIDNSEGQGEVRIEGLEWSARTENGEVIDEGCEVTVLRVEGVKAIVKRK